MDEKKNEKKEDDDRPKLKGVRKLLLGEDRKLGGKTLTRKRDDEGAEKEGDVVRESVGKKSDGVDGKKKGSWAEKKTK